MTQTPDDDFAIPEDPDRNPEHPDEQPADAGEHAEEIEIDLGPDDAPASDGDSGVNLDFADFSQPEPDEGVQIDLGAVDTAAAGAGAEESQDEEESSAEEDEAIAKALEELHDELVVKPGDWYVVHTYSGMENRVKQNIDNRVKSLNMEDFIYETVVPTEDAVEMRNGHKKNVTRTFLPGYVLVRMDMTDESWSTVRHTPSVTGFVGQAQTPTPLGLDEVERMLTPAVVARISAEDRARPGHRPEKVEVVDFAVGDQVMVVDGPFAGVHATITEINTHNQRLRANVEILGRETPVDLTFPQIQKVVD